MLKSLATKSKFFLLLILILASFFRLWGLTKVPVSLFSDEVDVGYQAYSILQTGKDYMGNTWPLHFQSYSDARTPLYIYAAVPSVFIFGVSPLGVRLPSAIFGVFGVWGMYLLVNELMSYGLRVKGLKDITRNALTRNSRTVALISALVLAVSPWHIQYSRAAFEVTMLLAFCLFGLYFFFRTLTVGRQDIKEGKYLWISTALLVFTPWIYSTAKFFTPILLFTLLTIWKKDLLHLDKKNLLKSAVVGLIVGVPIIISTLFGGGASRFSYISVFSDPTTTHEIDYARLLDAQFRGQTTNVIPKVASRFVHNKATFWTEKIVNNVFSAVSADFLFINGDPNLRHSIKGVGQFYWIESIALLLGLIFFFGSFKERKIKILISFWLVVGVIPSAITRDGGTHATRLILILPPLIFLISYGILVGLSKLKGNAPQLLAASYLLLFTLEFGFYQHKYWVDNPWQTERQWHAGFYEAVEEIKKLEESYEKIIISDKYEPPKIFFAGLYQYPPDAWQKGFEKVSIPGFDYLEKVGKFYFGHAGPINVSNLSEYLDKSTLYIAAANEVPVNLIREPEKTPSGLSLIKSIAFPSGEPAFYFFVNVARAN